MSFTEYVSPLIGRLVLAWFFASQTVAYATHWEASVAILASRGVPAAPAVLALALLAMGFGALSLALGYQARFAALLLFGLTVGGAITLHGFWQPSMAADRAGGYELFTREIALAGALLIVVGLGPGGLALDQPRAD
jgi:putative oxidoreductase